LPNKCKTTSLGDSSAQVFDDEWLPRAAAQSPSVGSADFSLIPSRRMLREVQVQLRRQVGQVLQSSILHQGNQLPPTDNLFFLYCSSLQMLTSFTHHQRNAGSKHKGPPRGGPHYGPVCGVEKRVLHQEESVRHQVPSSVRQRHESDPDGFCAPRRYHGFRAGTGLKLKSTILSPE